MKAWLTLRSISMNDSAVGAAVDVVEAFPVFDALLVFVEGGAHETANKAVTAVSQSPVLIVISISPIRMLTSRWLD